MKNRFFIAGFFDGFFYFFGLMDNPAASKVNNILKDTSSEKIKKDIAKINSDYRKTFLDFKQNLTLN